MYNFISRSVQYTKVFSTELSNLKMAFKMRSFKIRRKKEFEEFEREFVETWTK